MPAPKSKTRRRKAAMEARKSLARYLTLTQHEEEHGQRGDTARITALLWAQARIEHALAEETLGALGDLHSTPSRILQRHQEATRQNQETRP